VLFGYPVEVTAENWLHESVVAAVKRIHELVENGTQIPQWPTIIPEVYREKLKSRQGLKDRLSAYATAIGKLTVAERQLVHGALVAQNRIPELLNGQCDCDEVSQLPKNVREPTLSLFTFAFDLLTAYDVRQRQYAALCDSIPTRVCPFCGCESLDAPGAPQEDFDHYIPRSKYPFAAANLRNLAPMGGRCNTAYKLAQDPLRQANGMRRRACDPYSTDGVKVSLTNSVVDEDTPGPIVAGWVVEFLPTDESVETWEEVFHIRERWRRDVLDESTFNQWLGDFGSYCRTARLQFSDDADVVAAVRQFEEHVSSFGFRDRAFLKAAVLRFLVHRCDLGCQRLLPIVRDLAGAPQPIAVNPET
jgi:hypothetical protein